MKLFLPCVSLPLNLGLAGSDLEALKSIGTERMVTANTGLVASVYL